MNKPIDSHFHSLSVRDKGLNIEKALCSIEGGIDIGTEADDLPSRYEFLKPYPSILLAGAMGPWETDNRTIEELNSQLNILYDNVEKYHASFIGEIGLDNYYHYGTVETQEYLFISQLDYAQTNNMKVLVHNRDAEQQMLKILSEKSPAKGGIIHCCSGDPDVIRLALDKNYYISFAGNLTYKANQILRDALLLVPKDRLLLETDAPYLSPVPMRGKPNSMEYIIYTYEFAAKLLEMETEELTALVNSNFRAFCTL